VAAALSMEMDAVRISCLRWPVRLVGFVLVLVLVLGSGAAVAQTDRDVELRARIENLRADGRYNEAIAVLKRVIEAQEAKTGLENPMGAALLNNLGEAHYKLGLYAEAIPVYERALAIADKTIKVDNPLTAILLRNLAIVYQLQGRRADAARLYARSIAQLEKLMPATRLQLASTLNNLATLYQDSGRPKEAEALLVRVLKTYQEGLPAGHPYVSTALNNLGQLYQGQGDLAKAELMMAAAARNIETSLDRDHPQRARLLQNLGMLYAVKKDWPKAVDFLHQALDIYRHAARRGTQSVEGEISGLPGSDLASHKAAAGAYVNSAMKLMIEDRSRGVELVGQILEAAQEMPSAASVSLAQMSARRIKGDGPLAKLVRERQDLVLEWQARDKGLIERLVKGGAVTAKEHVADKARLTEIDRRVADIDRTLAHGFPEYAALINPRPLSVTEVQALLRPDEALVAFIETGEVSWVWVISKTDKSLSLVNLGSDTLAEQVAALRCGLDASDWVDPARWPDATPAGLQGKRNQERRFRRCRGLHPGYAGGGDLPFDAKRAHALYRALLGNAEKAIAGKHLLIVPSPSLAQLPFNTLVAEMPNVGVPQGAEGYRGIAWLGTRQAVTILPSLPSLAVLRRNVRPTKASKAWAGFGNPLLDGPPGDPEQSQLATEARARQGCGLIERRVHLAARGARAAASGSLLQGPLADVAVLRQQVPLPETADELCNVAKRLGVSDADVWLGSRATESAVKRLSARGALADYATLHFATHGLVAGESAAILKAGAEPALLLTPPATATEDDDGLLTASEVAQLRLDANWIVLSACNTAAGGAEGAEALSGLARAFFYAGARALLVSHWEVDSEAAVALTTQAFAATQSDPRIGRAEALRRSMLALSTDKSNPRSAHPSVWAPFVLVGEGAL
jgi:CHAT domain-containing protein/tetratricopeptide (TPR) repeat protein